MHTSPAGRIGVRSIDGTPYGSTLKIVESNVPANVDPSSAFDPSSVPTVIFEGAKSGKFYRIRAICPGNDCWRPSGFAAWHGPDGVVPPSIIPFNPYLGINIGALIVKMPGTNRFISVGSETMTLYATHSGNIIAGYADYIYYDNEGEMPVVVEELGGGPPNGVADVLKTITVTGTGGVFPEGAPTVTSGTATFYADIDEDGIVNLVDSVYLEGLSHTFISDVKIDLIAPGGQSAKIINRIGAGTIKADGDFNGDYEITDTATSPITFSNGDLQPGTYRSHEFMSPKIAGAEATGRWRLKFTDMSKGNTGSLTSWTLTLQIAARNRRMFVEPDPVREIVITGFETRNTTFSFSSTDTGTWSSVMPSDPAFLPVIVTRPGTVQKLLDVRLLDFSGWYPGGIHLLLVAPSGKSVTIFHRPGSTGGSSGNTDYFDFGDYIFEDAGTLLPDSGIISPGTYGRDPGDWPGVTVPAGTYADFVGERIDGEWTLIFYTWDLSSSGGISYGASLSFEYLPD